MKKTKPFSKLEIVVLVILAFIFITVQPWFNNKTTVEVKEKEPDSETNSKISNTRFQRESVNNSLIQKKTLTLEDYRTVLNKNDEHYSDEEINHIVKFIDHLARINAKTILQNL